MMFSRWGFSFSMVVICATQIPPEYSVNATVYHVNPASAGAVPLDMDTGDALGDLFFYLGEFLLPLECANASQKTRAKFDCDNPERVDPNLVVTRVDMEWDSRPTTYSACNLCNGTDPFTHKPCEKNTYVCDCFSRTSSKKCDPKKVGSENISTSFAPHKATAQCASAMEGHCGKVKSNKAMCGACVTLFKHNLENTSHCDERDLYKFCGFDSCKSTSPEWQCWEENIPRKTGGTWYSTLKDGMCNETSPLGSCGWKVLSTKTIHERCLKDHLMTTVESHNKDCFTACAPKRNSTSPCWISCFFDAVLGVDARHSSEKPLGGMSVHDLEHSWVDAFLPVSAGGCEEVTMPQFAGRPQMSVAVTAAETTALIV